MEILLLAVAGAVNIFCFMIGAKVGQTIVKGEKVEMPSADPLKSIRDHEERKEAQRKQARLDAILRNIDGYDGTERGQEEIPRG